MLGLMQDWPLTVDKIVDHAARWHADQQVTTRLPSGAIVHQGYREVRAEAKRVSAALAGLGVRPGDRVATLAIPAPLVKAGGRLDRFVRGDRAKLTPDRARYISHPDWAASEGARPPADLWQPSLPTADALAETVRWYRAEGWL